MYEKMDKRYIFNRDEEKCYFCHKPLKLGSLSVDHYFPRSCGGSYDVFNLVASCKKCNTLKKSRIPEDHEKIAIKLFLKAVEDKRIFSTMACFMQADVLEIVRDVSEVKRYEDITVFKSPQNEIYVKENKIFKIIGII